MTTSSPIDVAGDSGSPRYSADPGGNATARRQAWLLALERASGLANEQPDTAVSKGAEARSGDHVTRSAPAPSVPAMKPGLQAEARLAPFLRRAPSVDARGSIATPAVAAVPLPDSTQAVQHGLPAAIDPLATLSSARVAKADPGAVAAQRREDPTMRFDDRRVTLIPSPEGGVELWVRDGHMAPQLAANLAEHARRHALSLGLRLVRASLNGKPILAENGLVGPYQSTNRGE